jgi:hypothetical protein
MDTGILSILFIMLFILGRTQGNVPVSRFIIIFKVDKKPSIQECAAAKTNTVVTI